MSPLQNPHDLLTDKLFSFLAYSPDTKEVNLLMEGLKEVLQSRDVNISNFQKNKIKINT